MKNNTIDMDRKRGLEGDPKMGGYFNFPLTHVPTLILALLCSTFLMLSKSQFFKAFHFSFLKKKKNTINDNRLRGLL